MKSEADLELGGAIFSYFVKLFVFPPKHVSEVGVFRENTMISELGAGWVAFSFWSPACIRNF